MNIFGTNEEWYDLNNFEMLLIVTHFCKLTYKKIFKYSSLECLSKRHFVRTFIIFGIVVMWYMVLKLVKFERENL